MASLKNGYGTVNDSNASYHEYENETYQANGKDLDDDDFDSSPDEAVYGRNGKSFGEASINDALLKKPLNDKPIVGPFAWMRSPAWWPCWWGFTFFLIVLIANYFSGFRHNILPGKWQVNPLTAWPTRVVVSMIILVFSGVLIIPGLYDMTVAKGKKWSDKRGWPLVITILSALSFTTLMAIVSYVIGEQEQLHSVGLANEFWAIVIGILIINLLPFVTEEEPEFIKFSAKMGEDMIKLGLILLGIDLQTMASLGGPGLVVGIPVTIVVLMLAFTLGSRLVKTAQRRLCMIICGGLSVCGASASTAVQSVIGGTSEELTLSISIISIFTIIQMIAVPYIALAMSFLARPVIAAALGGCINSTASVIAAAGFLGDQEYIEIAGTVKIIQNAFLGFIAVGVALYWANVEEKEGSEWSKALAIEKIVRASIAESPRTVPQGKSEKDTKRRTSSMFSTPYSPSTREILLRQPVDANGFPKGNVKNGASFHSGHVPYEHPTASLNAENLESISALGDGVITMADGPPPAMHRRDSMTSARDLFDGKAEVTWYQMFWQKFPKFVIGFLTISICLTIIREVNPGDPPTVEESIFHTMKDQLQEISRWWFTLGFVGVGLASKFSALYKNLMAGADLENMSQVQKTKHALRFIGVYWVGQLVNIIITFIVAWAMFHNYELHGTGGDGNH